jgi:hypothetical protein
VTDFNDPVNVTIDGDQLTVGFVRSNKPDQYSPNKQEAAIYLKVTVDPRDASESDVEYQERIRQAISLIVLPIKSSVYDTLGMEYAVTPEGEVVETQGIPRGQAPVPEQPADEPFVPQKQEYPKPGGLTAFEEWRDDVRKYVQSPPSGEAEQALLRDAASKGFTKVRRARRKDGSGFYYKGYRGYGDRTGEYVNLPRERRYQPQDSQADDEPF